MSGHLPPEVRRFTLAQLRRYDGEQQPRLYVAYRGIVYDVTNCPKWRSGLHENQHFAGQDLTEELDRDAPHAAEVFNHPCVQRVGMLEG
ncbi:MAG: hypothetical protein OHK0052_21100 [Anaerolineales bacterium]